MPKAWRTEIPEYDNEHLGSRNQTSGHGGDGGKSYTDTILCADSRALSSDMGLELVREVSFSQHQPWKTASCNVAILLREGVRTCLPTVTFPRSLLRSLIYIYIFIYLFRYI